MLSDIPSVIIIGTKSLLFGFCFSLDYSVWIFHRLNSELDENRDSYVVPGV